MCVSVRTHALAHVQSWPGLPSTQTGSLTITRPRRAPRYAPNQLHSPLPRTGCPVPAPASPCPPPRGVRIALMHCQGPAWAQSREEQRAMTEAGQLAKGESFVPAPPGLLLSPSPPPALSAQGAIFQRPPPFGLVTQVPLAASVSRAPQSLRHF